MRKRFVRIQNVLLGTLITSLGFGACRSAVKPSAYQIDDEKPTVKDVREIREVYGPRPDYDVPVIPKSVTAAAPAVELGDRRDIRIVYGPPVARAVQKQAQEVLDTTRVYDVVEQMPCFPGGDKAMNVWIRQHLQYPETARRDNLDGRVIVTFIVGRDGTPTSFKVVRSVHPALDAEALRLLSTMPRWMPGRQNGIALKVKYTIPVNFRLDKI